MHRKEYRCELKRHFNNLAMLFCHLCYQMAIGIVK
jgi:hypothetical protein